MKKLALACSCLLLLSSCGKQPDTDVKEQLVEVKTSRIVMGTVVNIRCLAADSSRAKEAADEAFARIEEIDRLMSTYKEESEVTRLNLAAGISPLKVSPDTYQVLARSREFSRVTQGAFDITVGPFDKLWKKAAEEGKPPSPELLAQTKSVVGSGGIKLFPEQGTVLLDRSGMEIDLGGIAKGYAVDEALRALKSRGVENALIDAGGDIYCLGRNRKGTPWRVAIKDPLGSGEFLGVLHLEDKAVATSGDYERSYEIGDETYSHILHPRTGLPVAGVASITVIAEDATTADALATALSVLGPRDGIQLAQSLPGVEAMIVSRKDGALVRRETKGFSAFLASDQ